LRKKTNHRKSFRRWERKSKSVPFEGGKDKGPAVREKGILILTSPPILGLSPQRIQRGHYSGMGDGSKGRTVTSCGEKTATLEKLCGRSESKKWKGITKGKKEGEENYDRIGDVEKKSEHRYRESR